MPEGVDFSEVAIIHESGIMSHYFRQCDPTKIETLSSINAEMRRMGFRVLVLPYAPDPVVNDSLWRFQRFKATLDPKIWQDPETLSSSPLFRPIGLVTFHDVEYRLFMRTETP